MKLKDYGLTDEMCSKIEMFYEMHKQATLNLTAIKDREDFYIKHVLDSFLIYKEREKLLKGSVADIGTGGGFPGVILAIMYPKIKFALVDSIGKKCKFLEESCKNLGLENTEIINSRSENIKNRKFKTIVSRGVAKVEMMIKYTWNIADKDCVWVLYKGENVDEELTCASAILRKKKLEYSNVRYENPIKRTYTIISNNINSDRVC